jgi:hypothetical protein
MKFARHRRAQRAAGDDLSGGDDFRHIQCGHDTTFRARRFFRAREANQDRIERAFAMRGGKPEFFDGNTKILG